MWFFGQEELEHPQDPDVPPVFDRQGKLKNVSRPWVALADTDLQIRVGGGGGHPDPEIRGVVSKKLFCGPFGPQFGLEIIEMGRGGGPPAPPLDSPM